MNLFTTMAISFFGMEKWKQCIFWLNRIRNEVPFTIREDFESFFRLFYIIVHYEAGNTELLPSLIQSVYRYLNKRERLYKFETFVIQYFRKLPDADTPQKLLQAIRQLHMQIKPIEKEPYEKNVFKYFDFISWMESKIQSRSFAEVVREKAETANMQ